jgi:hypothetical protein
MSAETGRWKRLNTTVEIFAALNVHFCGVKFRENTNLTL